MYFSKPWFMVAEPRPLAKRGEETTLPLREDGVRGDERLGVLECVKRGVLGVDAVDPGRDDATDGLRPWFIVVARPFA